MKQLNEYIENNNNKQVNESLLVSFACLMGAALLTHMVFKGAHEAGNKLDQFWTWTFDGANK